MDSDSSPRPSSARSSQAEAPERHAACFHAVQALIARYGWTLLSTEELALSVSEALEAGAPTHSLEVLIKHQYTLALYAACRQSANHEQQARGFVDLHRYLYRAAFNRWPDSAEDVAQCALLLVYEQIERCHEPAAFLAFALYKLLQAAQHEHKGLTKTLSIELLGVELHAPDSAALTFQLDRHERLRALSDALQRLPDERQRQVLVLKYFAGLNDEAIAAQLNLSAGNVRVIRHRGLARLRKDRHLRVYFQELDPQQH